MGLKQFSKDLAHRLSGRASHEHRLCGELDRLLEMLAREDADLVKRLSQEQDPVKRRHLKIRLKVNRLQHAKGVARRLELQGHSP